MSSKVMKKFNQQLGATLLESLIALVVFSIGALGIAALQTTTLLRSDDVKQKSIVIWKAQDLADRIKASDSLTFPDGLGDDYIAAVNTMGGNGSLNDIATFGDEPFTCPAVAPSRCDDTEAADANACTTDELVNFDVWSVFCDPASGLSAANFGETDGENKAKNLDVFLARGSDAAANEYFLYLSWLSRSGDQNSNFQNGATVQTNLCGNQVALDSRLDAYCLRFR